MPHWSKYSQNHDHQSNILKESLRDSKDVEYASLTRISKHHEQKIKQLITGKQMPF